MNLKICRKDRFRRPKWMPACVWVRFGRNRCLKMVYFSRSVGIDFSKWRGASRLLFRGDLLWKKYLQKSSVNEWLYEKKLKNHKMSFNLMCVSNTWETPEYFSWFFEVPVFITVGYGSLFTGLHPPYTVHKLCIFTAVMVTSIGHWPLYAFQLVVWGVTRTLCPKRLMYTCTCT